MSSFEELSLSTEDFAGLVRLFPLPNLALFPHVMQPLHIFEPRYCRLLEDALATDRLIAMALLAPGWEANYEGRPRVCRTACLGRITTFHRLEDGTYNLLLLGVQRIKLLHELEPRKLYREAEAALCEDCCPPGAGPRGRALRRQLRAAFVRALPMLPEAQDQVEQLLAADIPLGMLTDVISFMLDVGIREKESLLCELDVCRRAEMLMRHLAAAVDPPDGRPGVEGERGAARDFPPRFSVN